MFPTLCVSQITDSLIITKDTLCYYIEDVEGVINFLYTIKNNSSDPFYLWIEKDNTNLSDEKKVGKYFRGKRGDMSLCEMAIETNITYGYSSLFSTFLKKIEPQETFTIQVFSAGEVPEANKGRIFQYLDEHLTIIKENVLEKYIKELSNFNSQVFYKSNFITLPVSLIN